MKICELVGRTNIPVARGMSKPMVRTAPSDPFTHGVDGQAETFLSEPSFAMNKSHAVNLIAQIVEENPNEIVIVATGPLSNIGMALSMYPELATKIKSIVAISGAFGLNQSSFLNATGDTPQSEWNVYVDPEAAKIVYESGIDVKLIGLDIATNFKVDFSEIQIKRLEKSKEKSSWFLNKAIQFVRSRGFDSYCAVIDAMAVAYVINPNLISYKKVHVGVDTRDGLTLGMTVRDGRHHFVWNNLPYLDIAVDANYEEFLEMVISLISSDRGIYG